MQAGKQDKREDKLSIIVKRNNNKNIYLYEKKILTIK